MTFSLVRSITTQTAEGTSAKPADNLFVDGPAAMSGKVEVSFGDLTWAGTAQADGAVLSFWRLQEGRKDRIAEVQLVRGVIPLCPILNMGGGKVWVTVDSFVNGTAPNLSVDVYARGI